VTTNKRKAENFYTHAVSISIRQTSRCALRMSDSLQNVKNRNRERKVPKVPGKDRGVGGDRKGVSKPRRR
jgi:hypothetical protein